MIHNDHYVHLAEFNARAVCGVITDGCVDRTDFDAFAETGAFADGVSAIPEIEICAACVAIVRGPTKKSTVGILYECAQPEAHDAYHARGFDCPCHPMISNAEDRKES